MTTLRVAGRKDVREEGRILERLGFRFQGTDSSGHLVFDHATFGEIVMACSPGARHWRRSHRRDVAKRMGIKPAELRALINGQATVGKRSASHARPPRGRRRRAPRGLRHLSIAPEVAAAPPARAPEPVVRFEATDPITETRRARWERLADERDRANAECRFPWRTAA